MDATRQSFPGRFILTTNIMSVLLPGFLISLLLAPIFNSPSIDKLFLMILLVTFGYGIFIFLYYWLAGGMEWNNKPLPTVRIVLFWVLSALGIGLVLITVWSFVRLIMAKIYKVPMTLAMGRLLRTTPFSTDWPASQTPHGHVCEKCGEMTELGYYYTFICASKVGQSTDYRGGYTVRNTTYQITDSSPVYLCNKCVILHHDRWLANSFRKAAIALLAFFVVLMPISILAKNSLFLLPVILLVILFPILVFHKISLENKEFIPQRAYDHLSLGNLQNSRAKVASFLNNTKAMEEGEKLAIELKKPGLKEFRYDAFFTHQFAKENLKAPQ